MHPSPKVHKFYIHCCTVRGMTNSFTVQWCK